MAVIPRLFDPAVRLLDRLRYPYKFSLISLCFALPIALLIFLLFSEIGEWIGFAAKERDGVTYLRALADARRMVQAMGAGPEPAAADRRAAARALAAANDGPGRTLELATRGAEVAAVLSLWSNPPPLPARRPALEDSLARIHRLNIAVANQSNLILDPDLDTYYLMDAVILKLPEIGDIAAVTGALLGDPAAGETERAARRARLLVLAGRLTGLLEDLDGNLGVAFAHGRDGLAAPALRRPLTELRDAGASLARTLEAVAAGSEPGDGGAATGVLRQSLILWDGTVAQLDRLLERRIAGFQDKRLTIIGFVAAVLLVVLYLFMGFYLAVMRTVSRLDLAARRLAAGAADAALALDNRDELGQVVHAFNRVAAALIEANEANRRLAEGLAEDNRHLAAELDVTRRLQQMILPRDEELRRISELDIAGFMEPAAHVGGDYYDVLVQDGGVRIGIGDVTGHGLESGVLMIMVQTAVRTLLASNETDTVKFFNTLNRAIYDNVQRMNSDRNLSLALVEYRDGCLRLSGQHEEMIVVRADGAIERIDTINLGFPIGLDEDISAFIDQTQVHLAPGDGVVLYTDGITEAADAGGRLYGIERLCAVLSREWSRPAADIREAVVADVRRHIGGATVYDDITLLVIKQHAKSND